MTASELASESWRNIRTGSNRRAWGLLILAPVLLALITLELVSLVGIESSSREYFESGASTYLLDAPGGVNGAACDRLRDVPGIAQAGAIRETSDPVIATKLLEAPIAKSEVTSGFSRLLTGSEESVGGIIASDDVTEALGGTRSYTIVSEYSPVRVDRTFSLPPGGAGSGLGWSLLQVADAASVFDQCWITTRPPSRQLTDLLHLAETFIGPVAEGDGDPLSPEIIQTYTELGAHYTGIDDFRHRPSRWFPLVAFLAGVGVAWLVTRVRMLELSAYLHDGWGRTEVALLLMLDSAGWSGPLALVAAVLGSIVAAGVSAPGDILINALSVSALAACAFLGTIAGAGASAWQVHERKLFELFKAR